MIFYKVFRNLSFLILFLSAFSYGQEAIWVENATGSCLAANITPEEAIKRAKDEARSYEVEYANGVLVSQSTFMKQSEISDGKNASDFEELFLKMNLSSVSGKVIEEGTPEITTVIEGNLPRYTVKMKVKVSTEKGKPDPDFTAKIILPKDVYYDRGSLDRNDKIYFKLWASKDSYLYLFDIMPNDSVQLILPNKLMKDNSYLVTREEQDYEKLMSFGQGFTVGLPSGREKAVEGLFLVALKEKKDFMSSNLSSDELGIIPTHRAALTDIMKWLISIPADMRTESFTSFEIRKK